MINSLLLSLSTWASDRDRSNLTWRLALHTVSMQHVHQAFRHSYAKSSIQTSIYWTILLRSDKLLEDRGITQLLFLIWHYCVVVKTQMQRVLTSRLDECHQCQNISTAARNMTLRWMFWMLRQSPVLTESYQIWFINVTMYGVRSFLSALFYPEIKLYLRQ